MQGLGRFQRARDLYQASLAALAWAYGPRHPKVATALANAAVCSGDEGRYDEALRRAAGAVATLEPALGRDHPSTLRAREALCRGLGGLGRYEEALACARERLALVERRHGPDSIEAADARVDLGSALNDLGRYGEAARAFEQGLGSKRALDDPPPSLATALVGAAEAQIGLGRIPAASASLDEAQRALTGLSPSPTVASRLDFALARVLEPSDPAEAERRATRALAAWRAMPEGGPPRLVAEADAWLGKLAVASKARSRLRAGK